MNSDDTGQEREARHAQIVSDLPELTSLLKGEDSMAGQLRCIFAEYIVSGNPDHLGFLRFNYGARLGRYALYREIGSSDARFEELIDRKERFQIYLGGATLTRCMRIPKGIFQHHRWRGRHETRARPEYLSLNIWHKRNPGLDEKRHPFHAVLQEKILADGMAEWPSAAYLWRAGAWGTELFVAGPSVLEEQEFRNWLAFEDIGKYA